MANEFDDTPVHTSESLAANGKDAIEKPPPASVTMAPIAHSADQARQIAEVQVMMTVAKGDPRQEAIVWAGMRRACTRFRFAQKAKYAFPRGKQLISGLGIKSIRELAIIYGNIDYGYRVLDLEGDVSWVEAYAWDMEKNVRVVRKFPVKHWRDLKGGGEAVESERDKYEVVAGTTQRRVRSCLEQLLPADYLEEAEILIDKTLKKGDGRPMADRLRDVQVRFSEVGVSTEQIEAYLQHPIRAIVPEELPRLQQIYTSIRDGVMRVSDAFPVIITDSAVTPKTETKPDEKPRDVQAVANKESARPEPTAPKTEVVTKPATREPDPDKAPSGSDVAPKMVKLILGRLRNTYKMSDEQIKMALGGPIEGAPLEELQRVIGECEKHFLNQKKMGDSKDGQLALTPPGGDAAPEGEVEKKSDKDKGKENYDF